MQLCCSVWVRFHFLYLRNSTIGLTFLQHVHRFSTTSGFGGPRCKFRQPEGVAPDRYAGSALVVAFSKFRLWFIRSAIQTFSHQDAIDYAPRPTPKLSCFQFPTGPNSFAVSTVRDPSIRRGLILGETVKLLARQRTLASLTGAGLWYGSYCHTTRSRLTNGIGKARLSVTHWVGPLVFYHGRLNVFIR